MTLAVLIVAAGRGVRAGGPRPKQWQTLAGKPLIAHTLAAFAPVAPPSQTAIVLHPNDTEQAEAFQAQGYLVATGAADRAGSVRAGLDALAATGCTRVLIQDAARPCTSHAVIHAVIAALDTSPAAAPALPVSDALWTGEDGRVTGTRDRAGLFRAQTPQGFHLDAIRAAHAAHPGGAADDVEVARHAGMAVAIVPGSEDNLKVTQPEDFARAERILGETVDIRLGNGFDVHRFCDGDHVVLCGVRVPHDRALSGHSDADVAMHALTDAIYGALAEGDIGQHFPPSDPQWKGAESHIFLRHAGDLARTRGFAIGNADVTIICEHPKIGPHAPEMRAVLAGILGLEVGRVSVKATTSERLGFTGRGEGIAAMATATLVRA